MSSTDDRDEIRIAFDSDELRDEPHWVIGLLMLAMAVSSVLAGPGSPRLGQTVIGVIIGELGLLMLLPTTRSRLTLSHFDFFGRINPTALARQRGRLAIAARVLEKNRGALKTQFSVITAAGRDRDRFPKGRGDPLWPCYVALASKREPVALFFYWGTCHASLLIHEYHYSLGSFWADDGESYFQPEFRVMRRDGDTKRLSLVAHFMGAGLRRALGLEHGPERVRKRLWRHQVTPENVQRVIDQFVARRHQEGPESRA